MHRLVVFLGSINHIPAILMARVIAEVRRRPDLELAAVCLPAEQDYRKARRKYLQQKGREFAARFGLTSQPEVGAVPPIDAKALERTMGTQLLIPPGGNPNDADFIAALHAKLRPTIALCFYYTRKFQPELLSVFATVVNYHNGALPKYRGLKATSWSVYHGERTSGFCFHRMSEELDQGPVLLAESIPVHAEDTGFRLDFQKAFRAAALMPQVMDSLVNGATGAKQAEGGRYFSRRDFQVITKIQDPTLYSVEEIARLIRAFGEVRMLVQGESYRVKAFRPVAEGAAASPWAACADGTLIQLSDYKKVPWQKD